MKGRIPQRTRAQVGRSPSCGWIPAVVRPEPVKCAVPGGYKEEGQPGWLKHHHQRLVSSARLARQLTLDTSDYQRVKI